MKTQFNLSWKRSKKKRKQRKFRLESPLHIRHKLISANLSEDLKKRYLRKSFSLRKDDTIRIMNGQFKNKTGKIILINSKKFKVYVEGVQRSKRDGTKVNVPIDPSNVQIIAISLDDKQRLNALERKNKAIKK